MEKIKKKWERLPRNGKDQQDGTKEGDCKIRSGKKTGEYT